MVYAKLGPDDPRVKAVKEWLGKNYTVEENPGMGQQGLYYYYHVMSKALTAANLGKLPLKDGKSADWRNDLATKLLSSQREDGSWVNTNSRWWEADPQLVTCFSILTLQQLYRAMEAP
jgi:squalene-hopene/tetraprenyl-beta-curcumene cyclase